MSWFLQQVEVAADFAIGERLFRESTVKRRSARHSGRAWAASSLALACAISAAILSRQIGSVMPGERTKHRRRGFHVGHQPEAEIRHAFLVSHGDAGFRGAHVGLHRLELRIAGKRDAQQFVGIGICRRLIPNAPAPADRVASRVRPSAALNAASSGRRESSRLAMSVLDAVAFDLGAQHVLQGGLADFILRAGDAFEVVEQRKRFAIDPQPFVEEVQVRRKPA